MNDQELEALKQRRDAQWKTYKEALEVKDKAFDDYWETAEAVKREEKEREFRDAVAAEIAKFTSNKPQLVEA